MEKLLAFINGKKTYICLIAALALSIAFKHGIIGLDKEIYEDILFSLLAMAGISLRHGVSKTNA